MEMNRRASAQGAFTLTEVMVVIAIIGLLLAVLLPSVTVVKNRARRTRAVAQFAALERGLEMFRSEQSLGATLPPSTGDDPELADRQLIANPKLSRPDGENNGGTDPIRIAGAHLLVHAMMGADGLGTPGFNDFGTGTADRDGVWSNDTNDTWSGAPGQASGAYALDPETGTVAHPRYGGAGYVDEKMKQRAVSLNDLTDRGIVQNLGTVTDLATDELLFVDPWDMPILSYRASAVSVRMLGDEAAGPGIFWQEDNGVITGTANGLVNHVGLDFGAGPVAGEFFHPIYNAKAPEPIPPVDDILQTAAYDNSFARFELDPSVRARVTPVRKDSYLLISAGKDARYGTKDDITNWTRETE